MITVKWTELAIGKINPPSFSSMITSLQEKHHYSETTNYTLIDILHMTKKEQSSKHL